MVFNKERNLKSRVVSLKLFITVLVVIIIVLSILGFYVYTLVGVDSELRVRVASLSSNYSLLSTRYESLLNNYSSLKTEYTALNNRCNALITNYTALKANYELLNTRYSSLEADYNTLKNQYDTLKTQILITPQSFTEPYNYIVFCEDTNSDGICDITYAKNGRTGAIEFSGANAGAVIQLAINALLKGGVVFIKAGVYNINSVIKLRSDTQLIGEGGTLLSFNNVDTAILLDNVYNVLIEKLKLDGGWSSQKAIVVRNCDGGHNTVRDIWIDRFFTAIRLEAIDKLVSHNVFENIYVFNGQYGIVGFGTAPDIRSVTLNTFRKFTWRGLVNGISVGIDLQQYVDNNYFEDMHLTLLYPNSIGVNFGSVNVYDNVFNNIVIDQFKENTVNIKDKSNQPNWFIRVKLGGGYQTPPQIISSRFILGTLTGDKFISQSGVATIHAGSTRVTVNHYLAFKPTKVLVTPLGQPTGKIWVENITSTSFDIVTDVAPTSDLNVAWYAEV